MIVRFTASNIVAMILFIPLLIALGLILAFIVPLLAVMVAGAGILFLAVHTFTKVGGSGKSHKRESIVEVKDYKLR